MRIFGKVDHQIARTDRTYLLSPPFDKGTLPSMPVNIGLTVYPSVSIPSVILGTPTQVDQSQSRYPNVPRLSGPVVVTLTSPYANTEIRYTLGGKNPTPHSRLYTGPITFTKNGSGSEHTAIKA